MRRKPRALFRVSKGDSDITSSCEMKDKPELKPLQRNPAFFRVRPSRGPFHLRQKTQGPSYIPIAEGNLLLRFLWKVCLPLQSKTGNQLSSRVDMGCLELSSSCCTETDVPLDLRRVSHEFLEFLKEIKPLVMYDVERGIPLQPMQGNRASSGVDL